MKSLSRKTVILKYSDLFEDVAKTTVVQIFLRNIKFFIFTKAETKKIIGETVYH